MNYPPQRYYPELARQRCPHCRNAMGSTPVTRIIGAVRVREHACPVKGCGCRWKTHELMGSTPPPLPPPDKPVVAQRQSKRKR